jgi:hypothetical protein
MNCGKSSIRGLTVRSANDSKANCFSASLFDLECESEAIRKQCLGLESCQPNFHAVRELCQSNSMATIVVILACENGGGYVSDAAPVNLFTYFRSEASISQVGQELYVSVAADSNAALFVNGQMLSRKVTRYREQNTTADRYYIPQSMLQVGVNSFVIRHFSWGNIVTFQRTGETVHDTFHHSHDSVPGCG